MLNFEMKERYGVYDLVKLMQLLRSPGGCPWDAEQSHESIRRNMLEEAYEAAEAIDNNDMSALAEELGDVLLQVVFHCQMESEKGGFTLDDVADGICKKLIYRHPHVFGDIQVTGSEDVLKNWDELKRREKKQNTIVDALSAVARSLPALWRAEKVCSKAVKGGLISGSIEKAEASILLQAQSLPSSEDSFEAMGQLLFSAVRTAQAMGIDPEQALTAATDSFINSVKQGGK